MSSLRRKRKNAILAITTCTIGNGAGAAVPTPGAESCKHLVYSAVEVGLCLRIHNIYFEEELNKEDIEDWLLSNGLAVTGGGGLAFVGTKVGHAAINEVLNFVPVIGWGIKGALAGSITASIGIACMQFCDAIVSGSIALGDKRFEP